MLQCLNAPALVLRGQARLRGKGEEQIAGRWRIERPALPITEQQPAFLAVADERSGADGRTQAPQLLLPGWFPLEQAVEGEEEDVVARIPSNGQPAASRREGQR